LKKFLSALIIFFFIFFCFAHQSFAKTKKKSSKSEAVTAKAVILVDVTRNKILYSRNIHRKFFPASTVKLLTAYIALEELSPDSQVRISAKASQAESSKVWLPKGARFSSLDLINAVLLASANDASVALAEAVSGTEAEFAKKMNKKAKSFGTKNSNFNNASGLPSKNQYSTAYDLYRIAKAVLGNQEICNIMRKKKDKIESSAGKSIVFSNHNKLLFRKSYPVVLLKTGYTKSARHCYAGKIYLNGKEYVFAFLKSRKPWDDINSLIKIIKKNNK
jgi:D-alanyl-D-alanine carboxypeptidase (penicillin-binding protein 5/6)